MAGQCNIYWLSSCEILKEGEALLTWGGHGGLSSHGGLSHHGGSHGSEGLNHLRDSGLLLSWQLGGSLLQLAAWQPVESLEGLRLGLRHAAPEESERAKTDRYSCITWALAMSNL